AQSPRRDPADPLPPVGAEGSPGCPSPPQPVAARDAGDHVAGGGRAAEMPVALSVGQGEVAGARPALLVRHAGPVAPGAGRRREPPDLVRRGTRKRDPRLPGVQSRSGRLCPDVRR
ncbi:MAG: hypothetical protein ACK56I_10580, partial [bacterium]